MLTKSPAHHGADLICDIWVTHGVSQLGSGGEGPLECLHNPMVEKWDVVFGTDVEGVEDVEDGREDGSGGRGRDTVQSEALRPEAGRLAAPGGLQC